MNLPPKKVLYKDLIELRLFSPRDGEAIFQAVQESLPSLKKFLQWAHNVTDLAQALAIYANFEAESLKGERVSFAGFDPRTGEFLLCVALIPCGGLNPLAFDIGYWVSSKWQNRGLGTCATKIVTVLGFTYFQAERIGVNCNTENRASSRVIEKCGFQREGILRNYHAKPSEKMVANGFSTNTDHFSYSLIPEDISHLNWFEEVKRDLLITPLSDL